MNPSQLELAANEFAFRNRELEAEVSELRRAHREQDYVIRELKQVVENVPDTASAGSGPTSRAATVGNDFRMQQAPRPPAQDHAALAGAVRSNGARDGHGDGQGYAEKPSWALADEMADLRAHCEDLEGILDVMKEAEQDYLKELADLRPAAHDAQRHESFSGELQSEVERLTQETQQRAWQEAQLQEAIGKLQADCERATRAEEQSRALIMQLRHVTESQDGRFAKQAEELAAAVKRSAELETELKAMREHAQSREASFQAQCNKLQDMTNNHHSAARDAAARSSELEERLREAGLRHQAREEEHKEHAAALRDLEVATVRLKQREAELVDECAHLRQSVAGYDACKEELERTRKQEADGRAELERLRPKFHELREMSVARHQRTTALEAEVERLRLLESKQEALILRMTRSEQEHLRQIEELRGQQLQQTQLQQQQLQQQQQLLQQQQEQLKNLPVGADSPDPSGAGQPPGGALRGTAAQTTPSPVQAARVQQGHATLSPTLLQRAERALIAGGATTPSPLAPGPAVRQEVSPMRSYRLIPGPGDAQAAPGTRPAPSVSLPATARVPSPMSGRSSVASSSAPQISASLPVGVNTYLLPHGAPAVRAVVSTSAGSGARLSGQASVMTPRLGEPAAGQPLVMTTARPGQAAW